MTGITGTGGGLGIVTAGGAVTVTVLVLVLARVDGVVGGVDGPTGTPGMISVEVTVVLVLDVGFDGGGDSDEHAPAARAAAATTVTTMDFNMIAECPAIRRRKHSGQPTQTGCFGVEVEAKNPSAGERTQKSRLITVVHYSVLSCDFAAVLRCPHIRHKTSAEIALNFSS